MCLRLFGQAMCQLHCCYCSNMHTSLTTFHLAEAYCIPEKHFRQAEQVQDTRDDDFGATSKPKARARTRVPRSLAAD